MPKCSQSNPRLNVPRQVGRKETCPQTLRDWGSAAGSYLATCYMNIGLRNFRCYLNFFTTVCMVSAPRPATLEQSKQVYRPLPIPTCCEHVANGTRQAPFPASGQRTRNAPSAQSPASVTQNRCHNTSRSEQQIASVA